MMVEPIKPIIGEVGSYDAALMLCDPIPAQLSRVEELYTTDTSLEGLYWNLFMAIGKLRIYIGYM